MVTNQTPVALRTSLASQDPAPPSDRLARIIAAARSWDDAAGDRRDLPPPRGGWARCFEAAAARGFLPTPVLALAD